MKKQKSKKDDPEENILSLKQEFKVFGENQGFLLIGLGNKGNEYKNSRHNVGQMCLDFIADSISLKWQDNPTCSSKVTEFSLDLSAKTILMKPQNFMNVLGKNVSQALSALRMEKEQIIVFHDDLEQDLGKFRIL